MDKNYNVSWRDYMTEADYKMVTSHMSPEFKEAFDNGFDDPNQLMGFGVYGIIMPWKFSKEDIAKRRKNLPELLRKLDEGLIGIG